MGSPGQHRFSGRDNQNVMDTNSLGERTVLMFIVGVLYEVKQVLLEITCPSVRPSVAQYQDQTADWIIIKFKSSLKNCRSSLSFVKIGPVTAVLYLMA
jgi:hypothetical protein